MISIHNIHGVKVHVHVHVLRGTMSDAEHDRCVEKVVNVCRETPAEDFIAAINANPFIIEINDDKIRYAEVVINCNKLAIAKLYNRIVPALTDYYIKRHISDYGPIARITKVVGCGDSEELKMDRTQLYAIYHCSRGPDAITNLTAHDSKDVVRHVCIDDDGDYYLEFKIIRDRYDDEGNPLPDVEVTTEDGLLGFQAWIKVSSGWMRGGVFFGKDEAAAEAKFLADAWGRWLFDNRKWFVDSM
jgi:hypothetical protein